VKGTRFLHLAPDNPHARNRKSAPRKSASYLSKGVRYLYFSWKPVVLDPLKLADYSKQLQDCQRHVPGDGYCPICGAIW